MNACYILFFFDNKYQIEIIKKNQLNKVTMKNLTKLILLILTYFLFSFTIQQDGLSYFVTAKSGLNYRDNANGKILGKLPYLAEVKIVAHTGVFEEIKDEKKLIKGEWVGIKQNNKTVYVFNAFLSTSKIEINQEQETIPNKDQKNLYADFKVFDLIIDNDTESLLGFINLSEIMDYEEVQAVSMVPDKYLDNISREESKSYLKLEGIYRERFLKNAKISETDKLFIYNYTLDILLTFSPKELDVVIHLSPYQSNSAGITDFDYMYGFTIDGKHLKNYSQYNNNSFVYLGKENPFTRGKMKPMVWTKISPSQFPIDLKQYDVNIDQKLKGLYTFKNDDLTYYYSDYKHLIVVDATKTIKLNKILHQGEFASLAPISMAGEESSETEKHQWAGKLFKDIPSVLFGFHYLSFGCPAITVLDANSSYISILCDNRH